MKMRFLSLCSGVAVTGLGLSGSLFAQSELPIAPLSGPYQVLNQTSSPAPAPIVPCNPDGTPSNPTVPNSQELLPSAPQGHSIFKGGLLGGLFRPREKCPPGGAPIVPYTEAPSNPDPNNPKMPTPEDIARQTPPAQGNNLENAFAQASESGSLAAKTFNANMMGDLLGARSLRITYTAKIDATFGTTTPLTSGSSTGLTVDPNRGGSNVVFTAPNGSTATANAPFSNSNLRYFQVANTAGVVDLAFAQTALQSIFSKAPLSPDAAAQLNKLSPADRAQLLALRGSLNSAVMQGAKGLSVPNVSVSNVSAFAPLGPGGDIVYLATLSGETVLPLPGSSGLVGRMKMSEDNNPIPRDRIIFNYDYFNNVPFTPNGIDVNRFQAGVEKTFADGRWSGEVRLPFAGTLAATYTDGTQMKDVQLGNIRFALKHLHRTSNDTLAVSSGIGVTLPTEKDQVVLSSLDGSELYRFKNQSVTVEPFIAALYTPNDRLFSQLWGSLNVDTSGGQLTWNPATFGGSGSARIIDLPILAIDYQIGYWLIKSEARMLRGLAPFLELHYNQTLAQSQLFNAVNNNTSGLGLSVSGTGNSELNLTAGIAMLLGNQTNVTLGASAPMIQQPNRTFDAQFGLRVNYLYGQSARPNAPMSSNVSGF
jgi:hypothetical protein